MNKIVIVLAGLGVLILAGLYVFARPSDGVEQSTRTTREIATTCDREMADGFHIHPILEITYDGEKEEIPANIGVTATCMTALHTHTPDGVIHVESPERRDFTLSDFFAVWNQPFNAQEIFEHKVDAEHRIKITVGGKEVDTFENTILRDGEKIVIAYEPIAQP